MQRSPLCLGLAAALAGSLAPGALGQELEELLVTAIHDTRTVDVSSVTNVQPDAARLLKNAPGANVVTNGPLTGIPQYRGLMGARIAVNLDGNAIAPAGPNWMDPPLSYAMSAQLESLEVCRGIVPVSMAQEAIGGGVDARTRQIAFNHGSDVTIEGYLSASTQSVNNGYQLDADLQASTRGQRFKIAAMVQQGDDAEFPDGEILPTEYERTRVDVAYGIQHGAHELQLSYGYNDTGETGTPALPMDIDYFEGDLYSLAYRYTASDDLDIELSLYASELDHGMTNYHLRPAPASPARWRQNIADTSNRGFKIQANWRDDQGLWRAGVDGFHEDHRSNIDNPNNPMFFVVNFNDAEREVLGVFLEREQEFSTRLRGQFGVRVNEVSSDAGEVNGTPAMMMPPAQALRDSFNTADRDRSETNLDLVAKLSYAVSDDTVAYLGLAQKQRGPSYQERYLWLPLEATAGLADGITYLGNIELDSERARTLELGLDTRVGKLSINPRVFYTRIDDYIQGTPLSASPAVMMVRMMNTSNGTTNPDPLQFNNVEAELVGFDLDWSWQVSDALMFSGLVNYVRGERRDIDDNLYRVAPPNMTVRASYGLHNWRTELEVVAYTSQDDVSATNREQSTPGYATVNLRGQWQVQPNLQLALGVDNLFDREYTPHLGGYNRVQNPDVAVLSRLPAPGVNLFARVNYLF